MGGQRGSAGVVPTVATAALAREFDYGIVNRPIAIAEERFAGADFIKPRPDRAGVRILDHYAICSILNPLDPFQLRSLKPRDR